MGPGPRRLSKGRFADMEAARETRALLLEERLVRVTDDGF
jgi:hypothetical protein